MPTFSKHDPGTFTWVELATTDTAAAKAFYASLFGWSFVDTPAGPDMIYTRLQLGGQDVAALYPQQKEQRDHGVPPNWMSYVTVESADRTAAKAKDLGGKLLMDPFDVMTHGRMAVVQDGGGAVFALWEPRNHIGVQRRDDVNTLCWNELYVHDVAAAKAFYTALFGWTAKTDAGGYTEWRQGETAVGGMIAIDPQWGPMPPHWLPYVSVADCDAMAAKAQKSGGKVMMPAEDVANVGRFALLTDPQGAAFAIIKLDMVG